MKPQSVLLGVAVIIAGALIYTSQTKPPPSSVLGTSDAGVTTVGAKEFFIPFPYPILK